MQTALRVAISVWMYPGLLSPCLRPSLVHLS